MSLPVERLLSETRRVFQAVGDVQVEALAVLGVTPDERALLETLARNESPVVVAALARATLSPLAEIEWTLQRLGHRGWVERHGAAARAAVCLTAGGRAAWQRLHSSEQALLVHLESALDGRAVQASLATLRLLRRALERAATPPAACAPSTR
jgi:DNA-binding MarR family transcriptional regulator